MHECQRRGIPQTATLRMRAMTDDQMLALMERVGGAIHKAYAALGVGYETLRAELQARDLWQPRRKGQRLQYVPTDTLEKIVRDKSSRDVARAFGCAPATAQREMRRRGFRVVMTRGERAQFAFRWVPPGREA